MSRKKIAIAVVHGIGTYDYDLEGDSSALAFSSKLRQRIERSFPVRGRYPRQSHFRDEIAWREVRYAHIFQDVQSDFLTAVEPAVKKSTARALVVQNIGDAAAYRPDRGDDPGEPRTYERVHKCMAATLKSLEEEVEPGAPLIILAHSLGGHVTSNYLWDMQRAGATLAGEPVSDFQRGKTLCSLITFGCNIPLFLFGLPREKVRSLKFPGEHCPARYLDKAWWLNFYDRDDPLGYPLGDWGHDYEQMRREGALEDHRVNVGNLFQRWNLLSHNGYWTGRDFYRAATSRIRRVMEAADGA
ncbi:MAG: hypothetical protein CME88_03895 [Hirschia sp.]|nr:hypothetical protein [Hirschia sp.]MBF17500.1 hypothetical protein [Hirschia sp.]